MRLRVKRGYTSLSARIDRGDGAHLPHTDVAEERRNLRQLSKMVDRLVL